MLKLLIQISYCLLFIAVFSNCSQYIYAPNKHNNPLFTDKNQARISGGMTMAEGLLASEAQIAYSPASNIGLTANFISGRGGIDDDKTKFYGKGYLLESGVGWFTNPRPDIVYEVYGGFGLGEVMNVYNPQNWSVFSFSKNYVQPAVGAISENADFIISCRLSHINYYKNRYVSSSAIHEHNIQEIINNKKQLILEPALTIRAGHEIVKYQVQLQVSHNLINPYLPQKNSVLSVSIFVKLDNVFRKETAND